MRHGAVFLPGIVTPAELAFGDLRDALGDRPVVLSELAIYDSDTPPDGYGLDLEIAGILSTAAASGFEKFHLAGYSAGGAIAAAFASRHGERLASLTLMEPAWIGTDGISETESRAFDAAVGAAELPGQQAMAEFVKLNLAPGVEPPPPPPGAPPPWMAKRPAAIKAAGPAMRSFDFDTESLRALQCPVLYVLGALSNPDLYAEREKRARELFADYRLTMYEERHHFDPPHRAEPERLARELRAHWERAEASEAGR